MSARIVRIAVPSGWNRYQLAAEGFWRLSDYPDKSRRAEGFNNLSIAAWPR